MTKESKKRRRGRPPGTKKPESKYLSQKQWITFQEAIKKNLMADFIFNLMMITAARVGEITNLRLEDIRLDERPPKVVVRGLKGGYTNSYPLSASLMQKYRRWMRKREKLAAAETSDFLFITKLTEPGRGISRDNVQLLFKLNAKKAGLPENFSCHSLRHFGAIQLVKANFSVSAIQAHLRQKSPNSALEYIKFIGRDREIAIQENMGVLNGLVR
ncbi:MAG: tyrosine recombinase XerC [Promethearchaeota archaeon]